MLINILASNIANRFCIEILDKKLYLLVIKTPLLIFRFIKIIAFCCFGFVFNTTTAQIFYTENFNNGCTANCLASTWNGWTVLNNIGGVNGGAPNNWFISCAEEGITPPGCGSSCIGDACLHVGADPGGGGDNGATFNETGATNATFKLAVSPPINTTGYTSNTLAFDFIAFGSAACSDDRAQLWLSTDGGATWPVGFQYCLTSVCCGACNGYSQGQWTVYSLLLPAAFDNNPNVRVAFHWRNNGNGSGTDPSAAIDDIRITSAVPLPLKLIDFTLNKENNKIKLDWTSTSEINFSRYDIERSADAVFFKNIGSVPSKGNLIFAKTDYSFYDSENNEQTSYYRLKMFDRDGKFTYSKIISSDPSTLSGQNVSMISKVVSNGVLTATLKSTAATSINAEVFDVRGKQLTILKNKNLVEGQNVLSLNLYAFSPAVYILKITELKNNKTNAPTIVEKFIIEK